VVVLDLGATPDIDLTAADAIRELATELVRDGRRLAIARPIGGVRDEIRAYGLADLMATTGSGQDAVDEVLAGLGLDPGLPDETRAEVADTGPAAAGTAAVSDVSVTPDQDASRVGNRLIARVIAGCAAVVAGAALVGFVFAGSVSPPPAGDVPVPNLVGLSLERAEVAATSAGLVLGAPVTVRIDDRPEGTVVAQDPQPGAVAEAGSEIIPVVSTGRPIVLVPDVAGQPEGDAIVALTGVGLVVRRSATLYDAKVPAGAVIETEPAGGTSVATGTTVSYTVSGGPAPPSSSTPIPDPTASPVVEASPSIGPVPTDPIPTAAPPSPSAESPSPPAPTVTPTASDPSTQPAP
jgi:serine/threonine-protein kinase